jgi:hypothetical protein
MIPPILMGIKSNQSNIFSEKLKSIIKLVRVILPSLMASHARSERPAMGSQAAAMITGTFLTGKPTLSITEPQSNAVLSRL